MRSLILTAAALIFTLGACNKSEPSSDTNSFAQSNDVIDTTTSASATTVDEAFVTEAMKGDNGEVEIGQLAQSQGQSQAVKDFGKQLVGDHGAHKEELASLAQTAGIYGHGRTE